MNLTNEKVHRCACSVKNLRHCFTLDTTGRFTLMTDHADANLLRDTPWFICRDNKSPRARAAWRGPGFRKLALLHRLVMKLKNKKRFIIAANKNLLDCRKANLQIVNASDLKILTSARPITKLVGVQQAKPPAWLKTDKAYLAQITIDGEAVKLGYFRTLEEAGCAWDAAAIRLHGPKATTNQSLGFITPEVAKSKLCRKSAKAARIKVKEHQSKIAIQKWNAIAKAQSWEEKSAIFATMRGPCEFAKQPALAPGVQLAVTSYAGRGEAPKTPS